MMQLIAALAIWALAGAAAGQTIFKCTEGGKTSYGEQPCAAGTASAIAVPPAPPADPELQARLARQKALLAGIEKERRATAAARPAGRAASAAAAARKQRCDKLRLQLKWTEEDLRATAGPATEPLRLRLRRQAEAMAVECPA